MSRATDLAWLAGLFDGEGSVSVGWQKPSPSHLASHRTHGRWYFHLTITNTHMATIGRARKIVGFGRVHMKPSLGPRRHPCATYQFDQKQAIDLLRLLLPYLVTKKEQAELIGHLASRVLDLNAGRVN